MKYVLLPFCLISIAFFAHHLTPAPNSENDGASRTVITSVSPPSPRLQSTMPSPPELHAVVVDMPRDISLTYASPETWSSLPSSAPPFEQPDATLELQFAMNLVEAGLSD